jgi:hypothetical protein
MRALSLDIGGQCVRFCQKQVGWQRLRLHCRPFYAQAP